MVFTVFLILIILLFIVHRLFDHDYASPSVLLLTGFSICTFVDYLYIKEWSLETLAPITMYFLIGGAFCFCITEGILRKKRPLPHQNVDVTSDKFVPIPVIKLLLFLAFQLIAYYMYSRFVLSTGTAAGDLSEAISDMNSDFKNDGISHYAVWYINIPNQLCNISGYLWACLFAFYWYKGKEYNLHKFLILCNFLVSAFGSLLGGSRMMFLEYLIALVVMLFIFYRFKTNWKKSGLSLKLKLFLIVGAVSFGALFGQLGSMVGRDTSDSWDSSYLFAFYCGAEIKNLDIYLTGYDPASANSSFPLRSTLKSIYNNLQDRGIVKLDKVNSERTAYNSVNGYFLGNVGTCYTTYYDDLDYWGMILVVLFSYLIYEIYRKAMANTFFQDGRLNLWIIFYAWLLYTPFMSFFAEQFYRRFSIEGTIRYLIYWWLIILFLQGTKNNYYSKLKSY